MTGPARPLLEATAIARRFGPTIALDRVDFLVRPGEVHALIGENGAGKSTLMNVLVGALRPDRGSMRLAGAPYSPASPHEARALGIALIHQELSLCPHLSVAENILLGAESARFGWIDRRETRRRALDALAAFDHPEIRPDRRVASLPLAGRQVVEICRALAADARVLLMDEPTGSLPRADADRLFELIRRLAAGGMAIVYISHFLEEIREVADRYTVLRDGRSVDAGSLDAVTDGQLIASMVGREMGGLFPERTARTPGDVILAVDGLAAPPGLRQASFELRRGEILGIAGLMGSGRTELVRALYGLDRATAGSIRLRGNEVTARAAAPAARVRQGFGYLSEDRKGEGLALPLPVADNLTMTRLSACSRAGWLDLRRQREQARRWIDALGIRARSALQPVRALSGGNQQKVSLGRLLHQDADILLLDEPTRGIDIGSKAQVYEAVARAADAGRAVLMVSSYLPELFGMADRLAVMRRGRLSPTRAIGDWTPQSVLAEAIGTSTA
ncbi:MAG: sugar ABC transporter ATP-binding protein [Gemmatimonadota bacterium]|jgi:ribose transport system ATP-binding protein